MGDHYRPAHRSSHDDSHYGGTTYQDSDIPIERSAKGYERASNAGFRGDMYDERRERPPYHGEHDEHDFARGNPDTRILLFRGLNKWVTEEVFAKSLDELNRSDEHSRSAVNGSLHRVILIREKWTNEYMGFGFAEYYTNKDATNALAKANELGKYFTIAHDTVQVSFAHNAVFPRADVDRIERYEMYTVVLRATSFRRKYHDQRYYPSCYMVNDDWGRPAPIVKPHVAAGTSESKEGSKKRKAADAVDQGYKKWQNTMEQRRQADTTEKISFSIKGRSSYQEAAKAKTRERFEKMG